MNRIYSILMTLAAGVLLFSCKKNDSPSVNDNILNYEIPEVPVKADYTVGAFYYTFGTFNANIKEVPTIGKYSAAAGNVASAIMEKHIDTALKGGVDYFIFSLRSANRDNGNYRNDSVTARRFVEANTANKMKFAIAYNFSTGTYGLSSPSVFLESDATKLNQFFSDIEKFLPYFQDPNYMKVNGKTLLYIINAHQLYSNDNPAIYKTLRSRLSALGIELYIVGMQERWSPPARYIYRFQNCVDAVYHQSYVSGLSQWDRLYLLPQLMDQNWLYSRQYFKEKMGVDYVPNISPAFNWLILNPTQTSPNVLRDDKGSMYKKICNVAKLNANESTRLILIDSWNKWDEDTQLEPAQSYGDLYLDITKKQFKR